MRSLQFVSIVFLMLLISCSKDAPISKEDMLMQIPVGFPNMTFTDSNEFTIDRWNLGKRLFYDPILSSSNKISCASCHHAQNAFSDTVAFSVGENNLKGKSNAPTLTNVGYNPYFTRAGGVKTLEMQVLVPIQEHDEFNTNILDIATKLNLDTTYVMASLVAYNRKPDPYVITRAIANFERSLISGNSRFDKFYYQGYSNVLKENEIRGMNLFYSNKTNCSSCHSGFNFSNYSFMNNGLYEVYADSGRMRLTQLESDRALFKVPTLRNIALTKPYMHDGSFNSLAEVIEHYNSGGKHHQNKSSLIKPLLLTNQEKEDLVAFLNTLTDFDFINNKKIQK